MEKLKFDQEESFLLSGDYLIDGKRITVNSVFNLLENQSAVNGIRHMIDRDLQQQN